jgi:hypothetical protein
MRCRSSTRVIIFLAVLLAMVAGCYATTGIGKVKEALTYDKETAVGLMVSAVKAYDLKVLPQKDFDRVIEVYREWQKYHNLAVDAVILAEIRMKAGGSWDQVQIEKARDLAQTALYVLVDTATKLKLLKE